MHNLRHDRQSPPPWPSAVDAETIPHGGREVLHLELADLLLHVDPLPVLDLLPDLVPV